jgi:hypothetical protein
MALKPGDMTSDMSIGCNSLVAVDAEAVYGCREGLLRLFVVGSRCPGADDYLYYE